MRTVILAAAVAVTLAGCAFGTNHVRLPGPPETAEPGQGAVMRVAVRDARPDVSGAQVGFKRNGYGSKTGGVELERGEPVTDVLTRDLVSLFRERGYRARGDRGDEELRLNAELVNFLIDNKQGFWSGSLEGIAVVKLQIVDVASGREVWSDIVRANYVKSGLQFTSEGDHQEVAERLYQALLTNIRAAVPDARSPLRVSGGGAK